MTGPLTDWPTDSTNYKAMLSHLKICECETTGIRGSLRGPRGPKIGKTVVIALALVVKGMHVSADLFILEARLLLLLIATMMVVQHQPTLATRSRTQSGFSGKPMSTFASVAFSADCAI